MASRNLLFIAALGNVAVALATYAARGWTAAAAHAAARNTARYSILWFMVAFAAPGLIRWIRSLPTGGALVQTFVAAHLVHFTAVSVLLTAFERAHISQHVGQAILVVLFGVSLTMAAGLTAPPRPSRSYTALHRIALYLLFSIFMLAFANARFRPMRLNAVLLVLALAIRHVPRLSLRRASPSLP